MPPSVPPPSQKHPAIPGTTTGSGSTPSSSSSALPHVALSASASTAAGATPSNANSTPSSPKQTKNPFSSTTASTGAVPPSSTHTSPTARGGPREAKSNTATTSTSSTAAVIKNPPDAGAQPSGSSGSTTTNTQSSQKLNQEIQNSTTEQEHARIHARLNWLQHGRSKLRKQNNQKIIIAANRLPVTLKKNPETNKWTGTKSSGGLVTGLAAVRGMDMTWIGWPGCEVPEEDRKEVLQLLKSFNCYPVWLSQSLINMYYNGFANNVIWPLFHYVMPPLPTNSIANNTDDNQSEQWQAYEYANEMFTNAIFDCYHEQYNMQLQQGQLFSSSTNESTTNNTKDNAALIWVQDYHLMLVPKLVRNRIPDAQIGWFLHTPFPASEYYRALKVREELLHGVLSANLVAFHVYDYIRHFLSSVVQLTSLETSPTGVDATPIGGCFVRCATIPIGIEPSVFSNALLQPDVLEQIQLLQEQFGNRKVILGVDRLDYMKGIPHKLRAFDRFLQDHEEWQQECVLVQVAVPSRQDVREYQKLKKLVHEMVGEICGRHSSLASGPPVVYLDKSIDPQELAALYRIADVCLITSVRDGMNLVSYEFVACQEDKHGVLILSEFAGAIQSLGAGSIRVNPWNLSETASAINQALTMNDEEKAARHEYMWRTIHKYTAQKWAETFLQTLKEASLESEEFTARVPPLLPYEDFLEELANSRKRLLLIDLLDCLVPSKLKKDLPMKLYQSLLIIPSQVLEVLQSLAYDEDTVIVIVSMHQQPVMERLFGHLSGKVILAAENGCVYRNLDNTSSSSHVTTNWKSSVDEDITQNSNMEEWMEGCMEVFTYFKERTPGSYTEKAEYSVQWYYDNTQADFGAQQARELLIYLWAGPLMNSEAEVVPGTKAVMVRPHGTSRAANIVSILKKELGMTKLEEIDFCACFAEVPFRDDSVFEAIEEVLLMSEQQQQQNAKNDSKQDSALATVNEEDHHGNYGSSGGQNNADDGGNNNHAEDHHDDHGHDEEGMHQYQHQVQDNPLLTQAVKSHLEDMMTCEDSPHLEDEQKINKLQEVVVMVNNEMCFDVSQQEVEEAPPPPYEDESTANAGGDNKNGTATTGASEQVSVVPSTVPQANVVLVPKDDNNTIACIIPPKYDFEYVARYDLLPSSNSNTGEQTADGVSSSKSGRNYAADGAGRSVGDGARTDTVVCDQDGTTRRDFVENKQRSPKQNNPQNDDNADVSSVATPDYPHDDQELWPHPDAFEAPPSYEEVVGPLGSKLTKRQLLRYPDAKEQMPLLRHLPHSGSTGVVADYLHTSPRLPAQQIMGNENNLMAVDGAGTNSGLLQGENLMYAAQHIQIASPDKEFDGASHATAADPPPSTMSTNNEKDHPHSNTDNNNSQQVSYFSVSLGKQPSRARYSLPNPYHVQNLLQSIVERLKIQKLESSAGNNLEDSGVAQRFFEKQQAGEKQRSRAVLVGPEGEPGANLFR
ncbi:unnamed protein product [Amoebophrya sp. A120]|nr:unnamed protein product [Amoebophrya sp. A120]|eukprot:GSA120T00012334001.1